MADLAPITAKVVASATGMAGGLADAEKRLKDTTGRMAAAARADGGKAGEGFARALVQGVGLAGGMKLLEGAEAAFRATAGLFSAGAGRMLELGEAARKAGADVAGFQAVVEALRGDAGAATEAITKLKESVGKALVEGQGEAFERLGLDAGDLLGMRDDRALATVASRLQELGGGVAEARAGVALFGDAFKAIRPLLDDGGDRLGRTAERLEKFGAAFGEGDLLAARKWREAMDEIDLIWKGLKNELGKGLLPIVNTLTDRMGSLADHGITFKGLGAQVVNAAEQAAKAGAVAVAVWSDAEKIKTAWEVATGSVKAAALTLGADLYDVLTGAWDRSAEYLKKNAAALSWESLKAPFKPTLWAADLAGAAGSWLFGGGDVAALRQAEAKWSDGLRAEAERLAAGAAGKANTLAEALKGDKLLSGIKEVFGDIRDAYLGAQDAAGRGEDPFALWAESADRMGKSLEGPLDKFRQTLKQVEAAQALGRRMSEELFLAGFDVNPFDDGLAGKGGKALAAAYRDLLSAAPAPEQRFAGAMERGGREAYSAITAYTARATGRESVEAALKRVMEASLKQEEEQVKLGREMVGATKALGAKLRVGGI